MVGTGRLACLAAALVVTAALCGVARGELTAKQEKDAEALIQQCGDKDFKLREQATKSLIDMGMDVLPVVRKAGQETTDAEVKMRCAYVASALIEKAELGPLEPSKVTLEVKDKPLGEALKELARQSGNRLLKMDPVLEDHKVTVSLKDVVYWQAVDEVCKSAGAYCVPKPREGGAGGVEIALAPKTDDVVEIGTVVGSTAVKLGSVMRQEYKRLAFRSGPGMPTQSNLGFEVQTYLEDRLPLMRIGIDLTSVTTADGVNHSNQRQMGASLRGRSPGGDVGSYWAMNMSWSDEAGMAEGMVTLGGTLELTYGFQPNELKAENIFEKKDVEVSADGKKLTVKDAKRQGDAVLVTLSVEDPTDDGTRLAQGAGAQWGLFLVDPQGKRHSSMGVMSGSTTATGGGIKMQGIIVFQAVPNAEGEWSLAYVYPGKVVKRSYPFMIQGVPLP